MPSAAADISFSGLMAVTPQLVFTCLGSQATGSGLGPLCLMDSAGILRGSRSSKERRNTRQSSHPPAFHQQWCTIRVFFTQYMSESFILFYSGCWCAAPLINLHSSVLLTSCVPRYRSSRDPAPHSRYCPQTEPTAPVSVLTSRSGTINSTLVSGRMFSQFKGESLLP